MVLPTKPSQVKAQQKKLSQKLPTPPKPPKSNSNSSNCCLFSNSATKPGDKSWARENWCCICRIVLAVIGIGIPLIFYLMPCDGKVNYEKQPVDLFIVLDASGSVNPENWILSRESAVRWVEEFDRQIPNLQVGIGQFSNSATLNHQFHPNVSQALNVLSDLPQMNIGGTEYVPAMELYLSSLLEHRTADSFSMCLFLSDGEPSDATNELWDILDVLKNTHNTTLVGAMIGGGSEAEDTMFQVSSCESHTKETCPNYVEATNFEEFNEGSQALANTVALQVGSVETRSCDPGLWWLAALLILPLLFVLLAGCCVSKKTKKLVRKAPEKLGDIEDPKKPAKRMPQGQKKKRFKWDTVAADNYLWNFSGGATPMRVNYGNKAPPSAPKDLTKGRIKRGVETWEDADGWTWEEIEEDQTLEEWAENKAKGFCASCCFCCIKTGTK